MKISNPITSLNQIGTRTHSLLSGLVAPADDHTQYVDTAGTRAAKVIASGTAGSLPASPVVGQQYYATDTQELYTCFTANTWIKYASALNTGSLTRGSLIFDNGTTITKLAPGTANYILQTNGASADPTWVANAAVIKLGETILGGAAASITVSTIPACRNLILKAGIQTTALTAGLWVQFNGDTATNYDNGQRTNYGTNTAALGATQIQFNSQPITNAQMSADVYNVSGQNKLFYGLVNTVTGGGVSPVSLQTIGEWLNTSAAISSVTLTLSSGGNFDAGSFLSVYGVPN